MPKAQRRLSGIALLLPVLLAVSVHIWSYLDGFSMSRMKDEGIQNYSIGRGRIGYLWFPPMGEVRKPYPPPTRWNYEHKRIDEEPFVAANGASAFGAPARSFLGAEFFWPILVVVPLWPITVLFAVPAMIWWHRHRRRRSHEDRGICSHCGYDLRASTDRCPECGVAINAE